MLCLCGINRRVCHTEKPASAGAMHLYAVQTTKEEAAALLTAIVEALWVRLGLGFRV
jgi:hypothetical protein